MKLGWIVLLVFGFLYSRGMPDNVTGIGDADELVAMGYLGGTIHPPGYPVYNLILGWATHIPGNLSIYQKASSLTIGMAVVTLVLLYVIAFKNIKNKWYAWGAPLALGSNALFWKYAQIPEVFAFQNLLVVLSIYCFVFFKKKQWLGLLTLSFALWHHQLSILLIPGILALRKKITIKEVFWGLVFVMASGFLHYVLLSTQASNQVLGSWYFKPTVWNWWKFVSRQAFSGFHIESGQWLTATFGHVQMTATINSLRSYLFVSWVKDFGWWLIPLILGLFGLGLEIKKNWRYILLILPVTLGVAGYLTLPNKAESQYQQIFELTERMYLLGYMLLSLSVSWGLKKMHQWISFKMIVILMLVASGVSWRQNLVQFDYQRNNQIKLWTDTYLKTVPLNARIICFEDKDCFSLRYRLAVDKMRPDLALLPATPALAETVLSDNQELETFGYRDNPFMVADWISTAVTQEIPIGLTFLPTYYQETLAINDGLWEIEFKEINNLVKCMNSCQTAAQHWAKAAEYLKEENLILASQHAWFATLKAPKESDYRLKWAQILERLDAIPLAKREYINVLRFDEKNVIASQALERLKQTELLPSLID